MYVILGHFGSKKVDFGHFGPFLAIFGHFRPFSAIFGHFLPFSRHFSKTTLHTMMGHVHTDTFQNEKFSIGMEDDRTSALKKQLMSMKGIRQLYDGLNSLAYRLIDIDQQLLYTKLEFDLQKIELKNAQIKIGKEIIQVDTDSEESNSCRFVKHEAYRVVFLKCHILG